MLPGRSPYIPDIPFDSITKMPLSLTKVALHISHILVTILIENLSLLTISIYEMFVYRSYYGYITVYGATPLVIIRVVEVEKGEIQ